MGMGWRALGVAAMVAGTLSANGCGMFRCEDLIIVHAPDELNNPSVGTLGLMFGDYGGGPFAFERGERTVRIDGGEFDGSEVRAYLHMPDGSSFEGIDVTQEHDAGLGNDTCLVTEIQLEPVDA